jgi:hypothetical protein
MSDTIEQNLREALAELANSRSTDAEVRLCAVDDHPRTKRNLRWPIVVGFSGTAVAAGAATAVVLLSSAAPPAFAGWSAVPTTSTPAALAAATTACGEQWNHNSPSDMSPSEAGLSETRGNYTAAIYVTSSSVYNCISAGTRASTEVGQDGLPPGQNDASGNSNLVPGPDQISAPTGGGGSAPGFPGGNPNGPLPKRWQQQLALVTNPTQRAYMEQSRRKELASGVESHYLGLAGSDVTAVTLHFTDGLTVDATVQDGWYFAWWPTLDDPASMEVTTSSGSTTATLGPLGGAQCQGSTGCVFSSATN